MKWYMTEELQVAIDDESAILLDTIFGLVGLYGQTCTTNSALKRASRLKIPAASIGFLLNGLRKNKLIEYTHIETNRRAAGSGRYILINKAVRA